MLAALLVPLTAAAQSTPAQISTRASIAVNWLVGEQNGDGSWGDSDADKLIYTTEVVRALQALYWLASPYHRGVAWLENHSAASTDLQARRFAALVGHRDTLLAEQTAITAAKNGSGAGAGWGLLPDYRADALDTALVLLARGTNNATFLALHTDAIDTLRNSMASSAWTIGQPGGALAFAGDLQTTIAAANALRVCKAAAIPNCADLSALVPLESNLINYASPSPLDRALIASYFALLRSAPPANVSVAQIDAVIEGLLGVQLNDGSWADDTLTTAIALRALASRLGFDRSDAGDTVAIARSGLRDAVNTAAGKSAMDVVTKGDLWRLTSLNLSYTATGNWNDLLALNPVANLTNVTSLDISGNACLLSVSDSVLRTKFTNPALSIIRRPVGDVSLDGGVTVDDQERLVGHLLNRAALTDNKRRAADLNLDDQLDVRDLYWMERIVLQRDVSALCQ